MLWARERWMSFWFEPARPTTLGFCRALFYGAFFLYYLPQDFSAWAGVSDAFWMPIFLFKRLHVPVLSGALLAVLQGLWKLALGLSCIGLFTRAGTAVSFILGLYLLGLPHNFGKIHHNDAIVVLVLGIMALSRCGDGWSIDRVLSTARHGIDPSGRHQMMNGEYTWPIRLVWVLMALIFFGAGVSKLSRSGLEWITSDNLAIQLVRHRYTHHPLTPWGLNVAQVGWLARVLAAATVAGEVGFPLALISRAARWTIVPGMFLIQIGILIMMGVDFSHFLVCYLFWVPWDRVGVRLVAWLGGGRNHVLLFDGACGLCQRTVAVVRRLDMMGRLEYCDAWNDWPAIARRFPRLNQAACIQEMHLIMPKEQVLTGFDAYRALARVVPLGWLALPLLSVPGVCVIGRRIYAVVASRRHGGACPLPPDESAPEVRQDHNSHAGRGPLQDV